MKNLVKTTFFSLFLFCTILISCKEDTSINDPSTSKPSVSLESLTSKVLSQKNVQVNNSSYTEVSNKIMIKLSGEDLPIGINFKGYDLLDDGKDLDDVAGDHIYTSRNAVPSRIQGNVELPSNISFYDKSQKSLKESWYFKCSGFSIVQRGEKCGGSTCNKSISGGDAWLCVCGGTCDFCFGSDCGPAK